ncbi:MAG: response regulator [Deltaproteobacteria bacterium]|nr:response regulator [Deltaproteobacteria bacterium]
MANILIIDDQPFLAELISEAFFAEGHCIKRVKDFRAAVEEIGSGKPDMALLDLYLQGTESWDLLHLLKLKAPSLPVLVVTPHDDVITDPRLSEADGYLIKDIYMDRLKTKISEVLLHSVVRSKTKGAVLLSPGI